MRSRSMRSLALALTLVSIATVAPAAVFTVDDFADAVDANVGDAACETATGSCTLRAAVQEANALAGSDEIVVPAGTAVLTIGGTGEDAAATGDLDVVDDATVMGAGAGLTVVDANGLDRVFDIGANVALSGFTIRGGDAGGLDGGGMFIAPFGEDITVDVRDVHVTGNTANHGGGIMNQVGSILTLSQASLADNTASFGAALENMGEATVTNVTVSANEIADPSFGDGVRNDSGTVSLVNVTVSGDRLASNNGEFTLQSVILADGPGGASCSGTSAPTSAGSNIEQGSSCGLGGAGDLSNTDPLLLPLADNGGGTLTHALSPGSPAIDAAATCPASGVDQRGVTRPIDGDENGSVLCDVGAYEFDPAAPPTTTTTVFGTTTTTTLPSLCPVGATLDSTTCRVGELGTSFGAAATPGKKSDKAARLLDKAGDRLTRTQEALALEKTKKAVRQTGKAGKFVRKFGRKLGSAKAGPKLVADEATRTGLRDEAQVLEADLFLLRESLR